jgi:hypothetical protein
VFTFEQFLVILCALDAECATLFCIQELPWRWEKESLLAYICVFVCGGGTVYGHVCVISPCVYVVLFSRRCSFHVVTQVVDLYVCHLKDKDVTSVAVYKETM